MYDLPLQVFARIHDSEPYVRASAVQVLQVHLAVFEIHHVLLLTPSGTYIYGQIMMRCKEGWDYIQQHKVARDLAAKLPCLLYDSEAFVRRAALDAINCLVENRSCQGMRMEIENTKSRNSLK